VIIKRKDPCTFGVVGIVSNPQPLVYYTILYKEKRQALEVAIMALLAAAGGEGVNRAF
jgi:hypothetical protein